MRWSASLAGGKVLEERLTLYVLRGAISEVSRVA